MALVQSTDKKKIRMMKVKTTVANDIEHEAVLQALGTTCSKCDIIC